MQMASFLLSFVWMKVEELLLGKDDMFQVVLNMSVILVGKVGQDNTNTNVLLELFVLAAKQDVFHQLRTVEQLGYVVFLMSK
jgi:secreted Zn-dependent insulinase-like peptidase